MKSVGVVGGDAEGAPNQTHLTARHVAFLDMDRLYFELERFKAERGWYNLNLTREGIADAACGSELVSAADSCRRSWPSTHSRGSVCGRRLRYRCSRNTPSATTPSASASGSCRISSIRTLTEDDPNFLGKDETATTAS